VTLRLSNKIIDKALVGWLVGWIVFEFRIFIQIIFVTFDLKYDMVGAKCVIFCFAVQIVSLVNFSELNT